MSHDTVEHPSEPVVAAGSGRTCTVAGCGRKHHGHGYCRTHHARWRRRGDAGADIPIERGTAGGVSYRAAHQRVRAERGPAGSQRCAECGAAATAWSYDRTDPRERTDSARGHRYSLDPGRYRPRCRSCHRRATARPGRGPLDAARAARLYRAGASSAGIAALLGVGPGAVLAALRAAGEPIRAPGRHPRR